MEKSVRQIVILGMLVLVSLGLKGQGYLHTDGKKIVDGNGQNIILRGIGTGNWMLQEGYMMQTPDVANTQHEFRKKLAETIGEAKTDSFYRVWLHSHMRRIDVDSMKSWGFNSIRVAMHYKWFTLPIGDEPVAGAHTWIDTGFEILDSLLEWCSDNRMYLILDLHGAPGGQGKDEPISDYDPAKPSLWESRENKDKTVALWRKLAERYSNEPWIGGYDLINEPNWSFSEANNAPLRELYENITGVIREVDTNHIIFIEGNWFSNDHTGLTPPWDDNLVYSFHKYWSENSATALDWIIDLQNAHNVPLWLGEAGENSNTWFTNLIRLCENKNIGWSWWPLKKPGMNNPLRVTVNEDYWTLIDDWQNNTNSLSEEEAFQAVLQFAKNHKLENCFFQKDVVDAMIRQPHTAKTLPFKRHTTGSPIFASDFDLGRNGYAYFDTDTGNYRLSTGIYTSWNTGGQYRNDGVDIEQCEDSDTTNGYSVGWTADEEWMQYTFHSDTTAAFSLQIRHASGGNGGTVQFTIDGVAVTPEIMLGSTGGWYEWKTSGFENIIIPKGTNKIRLHARKGGSNLNYFSFENPKTVNLVPFEFLSAETSTDGKTIYITLNKEITGINQDLIIEELNIVSNNIPVQIESVSISNSNPRILEINLDGEIHYKDLVQVSYNGSSIQSDVQLLELFSSKKVTNNLPVRYEIPGRIQAEDFYFNNGLSLEECEDAGGGLNTGYANAGDYLDYLIHLDAADHYIIDFRVATIRSNAQIIIQAGDEDVFTSLDTVSFTPTGGWQSWETQSHNIYLEKGYYTLRLLVKQREHNLNWFLIRRTTDVQNITKPDQWILYPNPSNGLVKLKGNEEYHKDITMLIYDCLGRLLHSYIGQASAFELDTSSWKQGIYGLLIVRKDGSGEFKLLEVLL